jgi:hypothetical protein
MNCGSFIAFDPRKFEPGYGECEAGVPPGDEASLQWFGAKAGTSAVM